MALSKTNLEIKIYQPLNDNQIVFCVFVLMPFWAISGSFNSRSQKSTPQIRNKWNWVGGLSKNRFNGTLSSHDAWFYTSDKIYTPFTVVHMQGFKVDCDALIYTMTLPIDAQNQLFGSDIPQNIRIITKDAI